MSKLKLYKNNETGEEVACNLEDDRYSHVYYWEGCGATPKQITTDRFLSLYTPLPEAPEVGSDEWAFSMMLKRKKVRKNSWDKKCFRWMDDNGNILDQDYNFAHSCFRANDWQLYKEPKPIVEKLPHEFVEYERILWHNWTANCWMQGRFIGMARNGVEYIVGVLNRNHFHPFVIPYAGNEHLEGTVSDGEHGAVPAGYVPPHVPKLGDDDYWQVGDEVVNLVTGEEGKLLSIKVKYIYVQYPFHKEGYLFDKDLLRVLYHKGSYVREDGTVHEHIPTRPHRIDKDK